MTTFTFLSSLVKVMGKQRSGSQSKAARPRGAALSIKVDKSEERVVERRRLLSVVVAVGVLMIAILLGCGLYFQPLAGPTAPLQWTPYTVTGNVSVTILPSSTAAFAEMCGRRGVPLVLRNSIATQWKAAGLWTPEYLQSKLTRLSGVYENDNRWFGPYFDQSKPLTSSAVRVNNYRTGLTLPSSEFFHRLKNPIQGRYLYFTGGIEQLGIWAENQIEPLDELLSLNPSRSSINVWVGQPHVVAHCHYDGYHNFYAQLYGTKKFTLFRPINWPGLYPYPFLHPSHAQAQVNMSDSRESERLFPLVGSVEAVEVVLQPGDLLYMPPLWFHEVESMEVSISVNIWTDSKQTELVEKMFTVPLPLNEETIKWRSDNARAIATSLLIYRLLDSICKYQICADVVTDRFVENSIDENKVKELSDKVLYFVHRLWSTRYRTLMHKKQLPSDTVDGGIILCSGGQGEVQKQSLREAESVLAGVRFGAYIIEIAQLARGLPRDTWELWVGNFVEYIVLASRSVDNATYVGLYLKLFSSCFVW